MIKRYITLISLLVAFFTTFTGYAQQKVEAKSGDGIYSILKRYGVEANKGYQEFLTLNKTKLKGGTALVVGETYFIPEVTKKAASAKGTRGTFPIFGKEYAAVDRESDALKGAVYYIVGGHGGPDPGAVGKRNGHQLCEDEYAYDVALRLARSLLARGATVYMITRDKNDGIRDEAYLLCDKDETVYKNTKFKGGVTSRLRQKAAAINTLYRKHAGQYQRSIVLHLDSRSQRTKIDIFFYYHSTSGKKLANTLLKTIQEKYAIHQPNRGYRGSVTQRNLYMLKVPKPVSVFIELGNIRSEKDQRRFIITDNREAVALWLSDGLETAYKKGI